MFMATTFCKQRLGTARLGMSGVRSPRHAQNLIWRAKEKTLNNPPCPITPILTSSYVHHLSHQLTTTFLSYDNVTLKTISAEK